VRATWTVVLPVKPFQQAKTRLAPWPGTPRASLAHAFFRDTLDAVLTTPGVARVLVVTDDPLATREATSLGALTLVDRPREGLNAAIYRAAAHAHTLAPHQPTAVLTADLPALRTTELQRVLATAADHARSFLADHTRHGTTLLAATRPLLLRPSFEGNSSRNHRLAGAREITGLDVPTVKLDVDTPEDLCRAWRLGVGDHTSALLSPTVEPSAAAHRGVLPSTSPRTASSSTTVCSNDPTL
jgi:2-phospho-L-lactate guanylyltransferase